MARLSRPVLLSPLLISLPFHFPPFISVNDFKNDEPRAAEEAEKQ